MVREPCCGLSCSRNNVLGHFFLTFSAEIKKIRKRSVLLKAAFVQKHQDVETLCRDLRSLHVVLPGDLLIAYGRADIGPTDLDNIS